MVSLIISDKASNIISRGTYDSLPKYKKVNFKTELIKKIASIIKDFSIIGPTIELFLNFGMLPFLEDSSTQNLVCPAHLAEAKSDCEKRIAKIAKKAGLVNHKDLKVLVGDPFISATSLDKRTIIIPVDALIQPENLPEELKLDLLRQGKIKEDEWIARFVVWHQVFHHRFRVIHLSQFSVDQDYIQGKEILEKLKNPTACWKEFDATIGHELAHCKYNHVKKYAALKFGLQLLAWPTFGLHRLFQNRILENFLHKIERKADFFSAKKVEGAPGLITYFSNHSNYLRALHSKYPEKVSAQGDLLYDKVHPPMFERIKYLKEIKI